MPEGDFVQAVILTQQLLAGWLTRDTDMQSKQGTAPDHLVCGEPETRMQPLLYAVMSVRTRLSCSLQKQREQ